MDKISEKVGYPVLEIGSADDIKDTSENKIANHFTDGRYHKISPIYLTQSYYDVLQKLRQIAPLWYYIHQRQKTIWISLPMKTW